MLKRFNLRSFRLLSLGGAKASTFGFPEGNDDEDKELYYN